MSDDNAPQSSDNSEGGLRAPPGLGGWGKFWWWFRFAIWVKTARLRFILILVAVGGTIAYWDTLKAFYEKWTRPAGEQAAASSDTEFWCPMHPTVVRPQPDKCPICGMPLSKRKKGEASGEEPLPPGVVSRVQLTPWRVALAGIQTAEVRYQLLFKEINAIGFVEFDERNLARISARPTGKSRIDKLYVNVTGQRVSKGDPLALLYSPNAVITVQNLLDARRSGDKDLERRTRDLLRLWGIDDDQIEEILRTGKATTQLTIRSPASGHILKKYPVEGEYIEEGARLYDLVDLSTVWIEAQIYEDELAFVKEGLAASATTKAFPNRVFSGKVAFIHPHLDAGTRTLRVRFDMENPDHQLRPGMYASVKLQVPAAQLDVFTSTLKENWLKRLVIAAPGAFHESGVETLLHAAVDQTLWQRGLVLAVPEQAVIDTGRRKIVYREAGPGVYEGVEVQLGPRSGGFFPVVHGLEFGERIAAAGSFLIDAETRLTSGVGSTYFGASGGPQGDARAPTSARPSMTEDEDAQVTAALAKLTPSDRKLAEAQKFCPILEDNRLGSMGTPVKVMLNGQPVFLCCKACEKEAREHPDETLAKVKKRGS